MAAAATSTPDESAPLAEAAPEPAAITTKKSAPAKKKTAAAKKKTAAATPEREPVAAGRATRSRKAAAPVEAEGGRS